MARIFLEAGGGDEARAARRRDESRTLTDDHNPGELRRIVCEEGIYTV